MKSNPFSFVKNRNNYLKIDGLKEGLFGATDGYYAKMIEVQLRLQEIADLEAEKSLNNVEDSKKKRYIISEFPQKYLKELTKIAYPECFVSCFMDNCTNAAVWGHYADSHKGVCLKFKISDSNDTKGLKLNPVDKNTSEINNKFFELNKINYAKNVDRFDFFKNIGRLPINQLINQWFKDADGNISPIADYLFWDKDEQEHWRKSYWENFQKAYLNKLPDWEYEREYRLLLDDSFYLRNDVINRKYKYNFEDLEAVIFGIKTSVSDKYKIVEIIQKKCKELGRDDFEFYQAKYSSESGEIEFNKLNFLKLNV